MPVASGMSMMSRALSSISDIQQNGWFLTKQVQLRRRGKLLELEALRPVAGLRPDRSFGCQFALLEVAQDFPGPGDDHLRHSGQARHLDAVTFVGAPFDDFVEEDHLIIPFADSDIKIAETRQASGEALTAIAKRVPALMGGSADLAPSTLTLMKDAGDFGPDNHKSRNMHFGIREHGMGSIMNGMSLHGGVIPYGATFLIFSDYMRPSVRLAALMNIPSIFVYTHDSVFLGEDGPTHQPVEHYFALRLIPDLTLFRPADGAEVAMAWAYALRAKEGHGPILLALTRQKLEPIARPAEFDARRILRGAYVLDGYESGDLTIIATGSEVPLAVKTAELLKGEGTNVRVVSAPSLDLFDHQDAAYRDQVLPDRSRVVCIEAGRSDGWYKYVNHDALIIGIDRFGASAPYERIAEELGFTPEKVAERIRDWK